MGEVYSSQQSQETIVEGTSENNSEDSTGNITVPFTVLCDNATQTKPLDIDVDINSEQRHPETCENSHKNSENVYLSCNSLSQCFCDKFVQTEAVDVFTSLRNMWDSSVQTDDVTIIELKNSIDCYIQTDVDGVDCYVQTDIDGVDCYMQTDIHGVDCSVQTEIDGVDCSVQTDVDENACTECHIPTIGHKQSTDNFNDYLHCDDNSALPVINESEHATQRKQDELELRHDAIKGNRYSSVSESEFVKEQKIKDDMNQQIKIDSSEDEVKKDKLKVVNVSVHDKDWKTLYIELEKKVAEEIAMRQLLEVDHREKSEYLQHENKNMKQVVEQYEHAMVELTEQCRGRALVDETLSATINDKEQVQQDLNKAEGNLMDAYKRIEKLKAALDTYKQNENSMKSSIDDFQTKLQKSEEKYNRLRQQATEKMDAANAEIANVRKQKEIDLAGLQAALKKSTNRNMHLQKEIEQKVHESTELSQICDELIKRVSVE